MDSDCRTRWEQLVKIHFETKKLILRAEENSLFGHNTYLQPIREERDALEHICRGVASYLGLGNHAGSREYLATTFEAARKHVVRGFFDAADWYGTVMRGSIREITQRYNSQSIRVALPDYYAILAPRLDEIVARIVKCREEKDASNDAGTYQEVISYGSLIAEIDDVYRQVSHAVPQLEELHKEEVAQAADTKRKETRRLCREKTLAFLVAVLAGIVVLLIGGIIRGWFSGS